jgi:ketosteroid isomerase-like protein
MASAQHGNKSDLPMVFIERYEKLNEAFRQLNSAAVIELLTDDFMFIMKDIPLARGRAAFENILR